MGPLNLPLGAVTPYRFSYVLLSFVAIRTKIQEVSLVN